MEKIRLCGECDIIVEFSEDEIECVYEDSSCKIIDIRYPDDVTLKLLYYSYATEMLGAATIKLEDFGGIPLLVIEDERIILRGTDDGWELNEVDEDDDSGLD